MQAGSQRDTLTHLRRLDAPDEATNQPTVRDPRSEPFRVRFVSDHGDRRRHPLTCRSDQIDRSFPRRPSTPREPSDPLQAASIAPPAWHGLPDGLPVEPERKLWRHRSRDAALVQALGPRSAATPGVPAPPGGTARDARTVGTAAHPRDRVRCRRACLRRRTWAMPEATTTVTPCTGSRGRATWGAAPPRCRSATSPPASARRSPRLRPAWADSAAARRRVRLGAGRQASTGPNRQFRKREIRAPRHPTSPHGGHIAQRRSRPRPRAAHPLPGQADRERESRCDPAG